MFWQIFYQCTLLIGVLVILGGIVGFLRNRAEKPVSKLNGGGR